MKTENKFGEMDYSFLETYEKTDVHKDWEKVRERMKIGKTTGAIGWWRIAAAIVALLAVGTLAWHLLRGPGELIRIAADEMMKEIVLPDGSLVTLNRGATLSYPEHFRGKERLVNMSGEAWFEVEKDHRNPFVIDISGKAGIEVLGTKFNVNEDSAAQRIGVQVYEGSVAFFTKGAEPARLLMDQGEQAVLDRAGMQKIPEPDPNYLSWKTGIIVFEGSRLEEVVRQLEKYYGIEIEYDPDISEDLEFTSVIDNQELDPVLEELCLVLGLEYTRKEASVRLYN